MDMDAEEFSRLLEDAKKIKFPVGGWAAESRASSMRVNFIDESLAKALSDLTRSILIKSLKEQLDQEHSFNKNLLAILNIPVDHSEDQRTAPHRQLINFNTDQSQQPPKLQSPENTDLDLIRKSRIKPSLFHK
jgi:hypothetical protein